MDTEGASYFADGRRYACSVPEAVQQGKVRSIRRSFEAIEELS